MLNSDLGSFSAEISDVTSSPRILVKILHYSCNWGAFYFSNMMTCRNKP